MLLTFLTRYLNDALSGSCAFEPNHRAAGRQKSAGTFTWRSVRSWHAYYSYNFNIFNRLFFTLVQRSVIWRICIFLPNASCYWVCICFLLRSRFSRKYPSKKQALIAGSVLYASRLASGGSIICDPSFLKSRPSVGYVWQHSAAAKPTCPCYNYEMWGRVSEWRERYYSFSKARGLEWQHEHVTTELKILPI